MDNKPPSKPIRNSLLQTALFGLPVDNIPSDFIVPLSRDQPSIPESSGEIESFIGQEPQSASLPTLVSNSVVNESSSGSRRSFIHPQSVPLVVPLTSIPATTTVSSSTCTSQSTSIFTPSSVPVSSGSPSNVQHFSPTTDILPPVLSPNPPTSAGCLSGNSYRLGNNMRKPTYAPVPGLSATANPATQQQQQKNFAAINPIFPPQVPITPLLQTPNQSPDADVWSGIENNKLNQSLGSPTNVSTPSAPFMDRSNMYRPMYHHWFYRKELEKKWFSNDSEAKFIWKPFSMADSLALENTYNSPTLDENTIVATDGGRYDVNVVKREKIAVYWEEKVNIVRRCSWFSKGLSDTTYTPYEEDMAITLEEEYKVGMTTGHWDRRLDLGKEELIMHSPTLMTHQLKVPSFNILDGVNDPTTMPSPLRPRAVKRGGFDDFDIEDDEPEKVDHLLFLVHGIGQFCDFKFRSVVEVVDEFRTISLELAQSHFPESSDRGEVNRIEILPVSWHKALHCDETGVDHRLKSITLPSVPRMREFSNDTILDALFYTSPVYCQVIVDAVANEMNRLSALFRKRNPTFSGQVSVGGHSLGSLIVFDILSNQPYDTQDPAHSQDVMENLAEQLHQKLDVIDGETRGVSVVTVNKAGTGQPVVNYPRLTFSPKFFFAFGSPIGCFISTRSSGILGENFKFPTCDRFLNIFHPYDPVAYRIEPLIIPSLSAVKPVLIPHHKGRKRMHLELRETVSHVGHKLVETVRNTWNMMYQLAMNKSAVVPDIQQELDQVLNSENLRSKSDNAPVASNEPMYEVPHVQVGKLNGGRRLDYVLQEAPVEYFNEYLFALGSHLSYWTSRDTILLVLKEIYGDIGVNTESANTILPFDITNTTSECSNPSQLCGIVTSPQTSPSPNSIFLPSGK